MRVAFIVGQFPALSETFILNQITGLLDRGADVEIFAATQLPQPVVHQDVERYRLLDRTHYARQAPSGQLQRRIGITRLLGRASLASGRWSGRLSRSDRLDANRALSFSHLARGKARRYDIIHCHFGQYGRWGMALRNMGILEGALVTTFHGYDMSRVVKARDGNVYGRLFQEGDLFLPISEHWRRALIGMGCPADRTMVHHMGVDRSRFPFLPRELPNAGERLRLLTVGRLVEKKGIEYAIRAVARVAGELGIVDYEIVGTGPQREQLRKLIEDLGASHYIRMTGGLTQDEVAERMRRAHVLLAPSVTARDGNQEGIPVVLMEAMATGLPPVSTYHSGIPELVEHEVSGLLAAERDTEGLAEQLCRLISDADLYRRLGRSARQRVEEGFDIDKLNDRLVTIYEAESAGEHAGVGATFAAPPGGSG